MSDVASLITIDIGQPDDRVTVHPTIWNALVREVIAGRNYDLNWDTRDAVVAQEDYTQARAATDAAMKG